MHGSKADDKKRLDLQPAIGGALRGRAGSRRLRGPTGLGRGRSPAARAAARGRRGAWRAGGSWTPASPARRPRARPTAPFRRTAWGGGEDEADMAAAGWLGPPVSDRVVGLTTLLPPAAFSAARRGFASHIRPPLLLVSSIAARARSLTATEASGREAARGTWDIDARNPIRRRRGAGQRWGGGGGVRRRRQPATRARGLVEAQKPSILIRRLPAGPRLPFRSGPNLFFVGPPIE